MADIVIQQGRPSSYSEKIVDEFCAALAVSERGVHRICRDNPHFPDPATIMKWLASGDYPYFNEQYEIARELQADYFVDQTLDIADDMTNDTIRVQKDDKILEFPNKEWMARSRLRVDTRKWLISKLLPKKYGDRVQEALGPQKPVTLPPLTVEYKLLSA